MKRILLTILSCIACQGWADSAVIEFTPAEAFAKDRPVSGQVLGDNCSACHGTHGAFFNEIMPPLAGMDRDTFIRLMMGPDHTAARKLSAWPTTSPACRPGHGPDKRCTRRNDDAAEST